MKAYWILQSCS